MAVIQALISLLGYTLDWPIATVTGDPYSQLNYIAIFMGPI